MKNHIDLHIHSNFSDGNLSPKDIIDEAYKNNVTTIAIADHDTIDAYSDDLYEYAKEKNIKIINAVEISTKTNQCSIHVLGYNFDVKNPILKEKISKLRNARHDYLHDVAKKLNELSFYVNIDELDKIKSVTKAHIALDVINNIKNKDILLKRFNHIPTKGEFIETIMNKGCPAYVKKETITPKEAVSLIKEAGGKAILAHPVAYKHENNLSDKEIEDLIQTMKADGIETNYIYINKNNQKINECEKWNEFAKENNLITTIGSDFHFKDNIHPEIGLINETITLTDEELENIIKNILT